MQPVTNKKKVGPSPKQQESPQQRIHHHRALSYDLWAECSYLQDILLIVDDPDSSQAQQQSGRGQTISKLKTKSQGQLGDGKSQRILCTTCREQGHQKFMMHFSSLISHLQTAKHASATAPEKREQIVDAVRFLKTKFSFTSALNHSQDEGIQDNLSGQDTRGSYIFEITKFIVDNNMPIQASENLHLFIKKIIRNQKFKGFQNYAIERQTISSTLEVIGKSIQSSMLHQLTQVPFSLAVDEGTTKGSECYLAITARHFNDISDEITTTKLLGMPRVGPSTTGEALFEQIQEFMFEGVDGQQRKSQFIGIVTDHASNMISLKGAGLTNRFKASYLSIEVTYDYCHALNPTVRNALISFPTEFRIIVDEVSKTFARSSKRILLLQKILQDRGSQYEGIKKYVETRWTSYLEALQRILAIFEPLQEYYDSYGTSEEQKLLNKDSYFMLSVLSSLLDGLICFLKVFESDSLTTTEVRQTLVSCKLFASNYWFEPKDIGKAHSAELLREIESITDSIQSNKMLEGKMIKLDTFSKIFESNYPTFAEQMNDTHKHLKDTTL